MGTAEWVVLGILGWYILFLIVLFSVEEIGWKSKEGNIISINSYSSNIKCPRCLETNSVTVTIYKYENKTEWVEFCSKCGLVHSQCVYHRRQK